MSTLKCRIVTPEQQIFDRSCNFVVIPAAAGEMGIYEMHSPVVCTLKDGRVKVEREGHEDINIAVSGGFAQVDGKNVTVLATRAQDLSELDLKEVDSMVQRLEEASSKMEENSPDRVLNDEELKWCKLLQRLLSNSPEK